MKKKSIAVIGLGRFGITIAKMVAELGHEVLGVDIDDELIQRVSPYLTHAVVADTTDEDAIRALSLNQFDVVVVAIGDNMQANLMTTMLLKEIGIKSVVVKAQDPLQGRMLSKIGVDMVIYPERDMAVRVVHMLTRNNVADYLQLSKEISLVELGTPDFLVGKTLLESKLRELYNINLVAVRRDNEIIVPPHPNMKFLKEDLLMIIGKDKDITALDRPVEK